MSDALHQLQNIVEQLRAPGGCPWDAKQDFSSMRSEFLEEVYEFLEALDAMDSKSMSEELGDLYFHLSFFSTLIQEKWDIPADTAVKAIRQKLIDRHPHVFGEAKAESAEDVAELWESSKKKEKSRQSILEGALKSGPALLRATRLQEKAAHVGFDFPDANEAMDKVREEFEELQVEMEHSSDPAREDAANTEAELGDLLFSVINLGRKLNIDPEKALAKSNQKFINRFQFVEQQMRSASIDMQRAHQNAMEKYWQEAKAHEI